MKKCPTCQRTFDDSLKFCQIDGTPLVDDAQTAAGGDLPVEADLVQTKIITAEEMEKELGWGGMKSGAPDDAAPPSPFGDSATSWMEAQDKVSDSFSQTSSPFDENKSSGYSSPSTPFQEPEPVFDRPQESFNQSPFGNPSSMPYGNQTEWTPPPAPVAEWQNQNIGVNTPFQPPISGQGDDKTLAIVSLVCGILSVTCCGALTGIVALITGFMAKNNAESNPQQYGGRGMALAGMILGGISLILTVIVFIFWGIGGILR